MTRFFMNKHFFKSVTHFYNLDMITFDYKIFEHVIVRVKPTCTT